MRLTRKLEKEMKIGRVASTAPVFIFVPFCFIGFPAIQKGKSCPS
jgi:hypothetical protein